MPLYVFQNKAGKQIERMFSFGECPEAIGAYERIISYPAATFFKGEGWARQKHGEHKVRWADVEKHVKHNTITRKEHTKKQYEHLKKVFQDTI